MRFVFYTLMLLTLHSSQTDLDQVVTRASAYADAYLKDLSSITGEERYLQEAAWEDQNTHGRPIRSHRQREMVSDFMTVPVGPTWIGIRHVREVDGIALDPMRRDVWREAFDES